MRYLVDFQVEAGQPLGYWSLEFFRGGQSWTYNLGVLAMWVLFIATGQDGVPASECRQARSVGHAARQKRSCQKRWRGRKQWGRGRHEARERGTSPALRQGEREAENPALI